MSTPLIQSVATGLRKAQVRTHGGKEHEAGEGDDPKIHGVNYVATIELEEPVLDIWANECGIRQRTNHKAIG